MKEVFKPALFRMLVLITDLKAAEKVSKIFNENHLPMQYELHGMGTASNEVMDILGLGNIAKVVSLCILHKDTANDIMDTLEKKLQLNRPGTGLAFTVGINGISSPAIRIMDENTRKEMQKKMEHYEKHIASTFEYSLIMAILNQGYSEDVMSAARQAGAKGGTVLHARHVLGEEIVNFLGIPIQEEKELLLILTSSEKKIPIMKSIGKNFGMHSEAKGLVLSVPIEAVAGTDAKELELDE